MAQKTLPDQVIAYMNAKYDDTFAYHGPFGGGTGGPTQMLLESDKFPGETFWIGCYKENGKLIVDETYPRVKFLKQTRDLITSILNDVIETDYYMIDCGGGERSVSEKFSNELTFEEYIADKKAGISFFITVDGLITDAGHSKFETKLVEAFTGNNVCVSWGRIDFVEKHDVYEKYKANTAVVMADLTGECAMQKTDLSMNADGTAKPFKWE